MAVKCKDCGGELVPRYRVKGRCWRCYQRQKNQRYQERKRLREGRHLPLPIEPLRALMTDEPQRMALQLYAARPQTSEAVWRKRVNRLICREYETMTFALADEFCVALGTHLALVYPSLYEEDVA